MKEKIIRKPFKLMHMNWDNNKNINNSILKNEKSKKCKTAKMNMIKNFHFNSNIIIFYNNTI